MSWVRLDDQFFGNPKARRVGKDGRELFIASLCYAAAQLTDGEIPRDVLDVLAAQAQVKATPTARRLVEVGLWHDKGDHYEIHGFHEYNESAAQVRQRRERDRLRKQTQRRNPQGQFTVSHADTPGDTTEDGDRDSPPESTGESAPSHPIPSTDVLKSSSSTSENAPGSDDDDLIEQALDVIADDRIAAVATPPTSPNGYRRRVLTEVRSQHGARAVELAPAFTGDPVGLAHALEQPRQRPPAETSRRDPFDDQAKAAAAIRDRHTDPCETCGGPGMVETPDGAVDCPDCR